MECYPGVANDYFCGFENPAVAQVMYLTAPGLIKKVDSCHAWLLRAGEEATLEALDTYQGSI